MFKDLLVFIFSFTLVFILVIYCLLLSLSNFLTTENIIKTLKKCDFNAFYVNEIGEDSKVINSFKIVLRNANIPEKSIIKIVNSDETKEFFGEFIGKTIENTIKEEESPIFKEDDVVKLVEDNMVIIENELLKEDITLSDEMKTEILTLTKENAHIITENMPSSKEIIAMTGNDKLSEIISFSKFLLSKDTKMFVLISLIVNSLMLVLLRLKGFRFLKTLSAPLIINAIFLIVISLGLSEIISEFVLSSSKTFEMIFTPIMDSLFNTLFKYGIFSFTIALVFIVIYNIVRKVLYK